jgi:lambda family phage minor tail protein L
MPEGSYDIVDKEQAKKSIKSLMHELTNLTPSSLMTLFEIDFTNVVQSINSSLVKDSNEIGLFPNFEQGKENILRFHNNIKVFNSYIIWQGKTFFPAPIMAEGFEITSRGVLPSPTLSLTSQTEEGIEALSIIRRVIRKYGDIVGAKVTRIRTFAKFLDKNNFSDISSPDSQRGIYASNFPEEYEPDPYAELPRDVFFVERKASEDKNSINYELSSSLDVEGVKLPRRVVTASKCGFTYRGCGCFYEGDGNSAQSLADHVYKKCGIRRTDLTLPEDAPPVATINDQNIKDMIGVSEFVFKGRYSSKAFYESGDYIYMEKNGIRYYFVAKVDIPATENTEYSPPNPDFWIADLCSKTLQGCRKRWGAQGSVVIGESEDFKKGELQFGGFPNATKLEQNAR